MSSEALAKEEAIHLKLELDCHGRPAKAGLPRNDREILAAFGFVRNVEQTAESILGITLAFSVVPFLFAILKAAAIWIYPLTQVKVDQIENDLRERRAVAG